MSATLSAASAGQFEVGGDFTINRFGFGAMRLTGKSIWGDPEDLAAARDTLARLPSLASISSTLPIPTARLSARI